MVAIEAEVVPGEDQLYQVAEVSRGWFLYCSGVEGLLTGCDPLLVGDIGVE